jgi:DNA-binding phage protein
MSEEQAIADELALRVDRLGGLYHVAETYGYDRRNLAKYMKGTSTPAPGTLLKLLALLEIDVPDFFRGVVKRLEA